MRISDWSSDVCSSDLGEGSAKARPGVGRRIERAARSVVRPRPLVSARAARLQAFQKLLGTAAFLQLLEHGRGILHLVLQHALEIRLVGDVAPRPADLDRQIGRAWFMERGCHVDENSVVAVSLTKKNKQTSNR